IEFPNQSGSQLYASVLSALSQVYNSPKDVVSRVENKSITVSAAESDAIRRNKLHVFDIDYSVTFLFKNGKIRIDAPSIKLTTFSDKLRTLHLVANNSLSGAHLGIWNKKLDLKSGIAKDDLGRFFNKFIFLLISTMEDQDNW